MGFPTFCLRFFLLKVREISNKHRQNEPWEQIQQVRGQAIPLFCKSIPEVAAQAQTGGFWNGNVAVGCTLTRQVGVNVVQLKGRAISLSRPLCILAYLGWVHGLAAYVELLMDVPFCIEENLWSKKREKKSLLLNSTKNSYIECTQKINIYANNCGWMKLDSTGCGLKV